MIERLTYRPDGSLDARTALAPYRGAWNARFAAHLLRRAGFGGSPADVARFAAMPMERAVDELVTFGPTPGLLDAPPDLPSAEEVRAALLAFRQGRKGDGAVDEAAIKAARKQIGMLRRRSIVALQTWWLDRMIASPSPLQEKMTLFWHGHFTSAIGQKGITGDEMLAQNQLFRRMALGNVHDLTLAVAQDPAMLKYLDNARSVREHPNENFARELMELYTLGIGNYTETDVRESARAFTGWTVRPPRFGGGFAFNRRAHDDGQKTFLGQTGNFDGTDVIRIIFEQPAAARYFATKLLAFFVYSDPEPELVDQVAALLRAQKYDLRPVMSTLLRSSVFYSARTYRALVKSPVQFVVGTYQLYGVGAVSLPALAALRRMDQILFYPPNVKGWSGGIAWINSQSLIVRENFASAFLNARDQIPANGWLLSADRGGTEAVTADLVARILDGDASASARAHIAAFLGSDVAAGDRIRGAAYLAMATPAYQLS